MSAEDDIRIEEARADRERRVRETVYAYKRLFESEDGTTVLEDIKNSFGVEMPAFLPTNTRVGGNITYDTHYAAIRDGQRSVHQHIVNMLRAKVEPSGNLKAAPSILTGLRGN
jgi:hypothetical protein